MSQKDKAEPDEQAKSEVEDADIVMSNGEGT